MPELKETKAQRVERLKRQMNPWLHLDAIRDFARHGHDSIPPEWLSTYFRPWGVYTQGDSVGLSTTGACGDVTRNITGCPLAGLHAGEVADVSPIALAIDKELAGNPDFYNLPRKFKITVTACPDWCSYPEINDIALTATLRPLRSAGFQPAAVQGLSRHSDRSDSAFSSAPAFGAPGRGAEESLFTSFRGSELQPRHTTSANNGLQPLRTPAPASSADAAGAAASASSRPGPASASSTSHDSRITSHELGFSLRVAGGLSTEPHLAVRLNTFIRQDQVIPVIRAITEIFRESDVLRQSRDRARLKYLFLEHRWTPASFLAAIEQRLGHSLDPAEHEDLPSQIHRDHLGLQAQKQPGLFSIGASVIRGRITPAQLRLAAGLAERFADGHIRTTPMQNLLLVNIPEAHVPAVVSALVAGGLPVESSPFVRGTVACTGSEFCKLALTETKSFARWLTEQLDDRFPGFRDDIKLHITGCPNSCGQHWIADIGVEGKKIKVDGKFVDAYYFCVGGAVGQFASIARPVGYRCRAEEVPDAIARLLRTYYAERSPHDTLQHFLSTQSTEALRAILAGGPAPIALRDLPAAQVPHSLEDR